MLKAKIKFFVIFAIIFTALINFLFLGYILYYEIGGYREINNSIKWEFNNSVAQNNWNNVEYNSLCYSLEPKIFLMIYHNLEYYSLLSVEFLAIILIIFFVVYRKELSKKTIIKLVVVFITLLIFNFILSAYEADYDFVLPCMYGDLFFNRKTIVSFYKL